MVPIDVASTLVDLAKYAMDKGESVAKDFKLDVKLLPALQRFADTIAVPITLTAVGGDLIHVEVSPEVKAGGVTA